MSEVRDSRPKKRRDLKDNLVRFEAEHVWAKKEMVTFANRKKQDTRFFLPASFSIIGVFRSLGTNFSPSIYFYSLFRFMVVCFESRKLWFR